MSSGDKPSYLKGRGRGKKTTDTLNGSGVNINRSKTNTILGDGHIFEGKKDQNNDTNSNGTKKLDEDNLLKQLCKKYGSDGTAELDSLGKTATFVQRNIDDDDDPCIVCLEEIKRADPIWSCGQCFAQYHIGCIQSWAREYRQQRLLEANREVEFPSLVEPGAVSRHAIREAEVKRAAQLWSCPKCRSEFPMMLLPQRYRCFCGKLDDPPDDPWILAHSCGELCTRELTPACGHTCLLLCHPGPCPPCPLVVKNKCHCGSRCESRRCGQREWSCGGECGQVLSCGQHPCSEPCHPGQCQPCPRTSQQRCRCGAGRMLRPCAEPEWQCDAVCGRPLSCGQHTCERVCHRGDCGTCPRSGMRRCPCGRVQVSLPCTENVPTCLDTCGKTLDCGLHVCDRSCHYGECGTCREMTMKTCRCGGTSQMIQCCRELTCGSKCTKQRDCGRHACKRRCCPGGESCPPCEHICGRQLACRNHRCQARCHDGRCYPCSQTVTLKCPCGLSTKTVPCGAEKNPKFKVVCRRMCHRPSKCRHANPHPCHSDEAGCPICKVVCGNGLSCGHTCPARCHDAVVTRVRLNKQKLAGPWEAQGDGRIELVAHPCPPCQHPIPVECLGGHQILSLPCPGKPASCGVPCGRPLACTNHSCSRECHTVEVGLDKDHLSANCEECTRNCSQPRPVGCSHPCSLGGCHPGQCPPCPRLTPTPCYCTAITLQIACAELLRMSPAARAVKLACPGRCPKMLSGCGHQCPRNCHPGECTQGTDSARCQTKVPCYCPCGRKKMNFACYKVSQGKIRIQCDPERCSSGIQADAVCREGKKADDTESTCTEDSEVRPRQTGRKGRRNRSQPAAGTTTNKAGSGVWMVRFRRSIPFILVVLFIAFVVWALFEV